MPTVLEFSQGSILAAKAILRCWDMDALSPSVHLQWWVLSARAQHLSLSPRGDQSLWLAVQVIDAHSHLLQMEKREKDGLAPNRNLVLPWAAEVLQYPEMVWGGRMPPCRQDLRDYSLMPNGLSCNLCLHILQHCRFVLNSLGYSSRKPSPDA